MDKYDSKVLAKRAVKDAFLKLKPKDQAKNPVMLMVFISAIMTAILFLLSLAGIADQQPGFILAIQERNGAQFLWVAVFFLLLQEGMGNMAFGGTLLWYALAVFLFRLGHNLFEAESFLFIFLLSG